MNALCTICSDYFNYAQKDISACPCGHTFHYTCLTKWLFQSKTCPQCRNKTLDKNVVWKLYFESSVPAEQDYGDLMNQLDSAKAELLANNMTVKSLLNEKITFDSKLQIAKVEIDSLHMSLNNKKTTIFGLKQQLEQMDSYIAEAALAKSECEAIKLKLTELTQLSSLMDGTEEEVDNLLKAYGFKKPDAKMLSLVRVCATLQKEMKLLNKRVKTLNFENAVLRKDKTRMHSTIQEKMLQCENLEVELKELRDAYTSVQKKLTKVSSGLLSPSGQPLSSCFKRLINESPAPYLSPLAESENLFPLRVKISGKSPHVVTPKVMNPNRRKNGVSNGPSHLSSKVHGPPLVKRRTFVSVAQPAGGMLASSSGYNGLGGHSKSDSLMPKTRVVAKKKAAMKKTPSKTSTQKNSNTMHKFVKKGCALNLPGTSTATS